MKTFFLLVPVGLLLACAPAARDAPLASATFGVIIDRTGINSEPSWGDAITLAKKDANAGLVQAGYRKLEFGLVIEDSGNEPKLALPRAEALVHDKHVKALILDTSQNVNAINRTFYDDDANNDLGVPLICGSCTSASMNNPLATDPDAVTQKALRNGLAWNYRAVMSTNRISQVLVRLMLQNNNGDSNKDGIVKVAFYGSDETFGHGAAKDLQFYLNLLHPTPAVIVEQLFHPNDADPNTYAWADDMAKLTDNRNATSGVADGIPDFIVVADFAQQQAATIKAYLNAKSPVPMLHYHSVRFSSVLQSLGSLADGVEGVSHVLIDLNASGAAFNTEYNREYGVKVVYRDAHYYDAAMVLMLASLIATGGVDDPSLLTGDALRRAIPLTSTVGGKVIGVGKAEFARAIQLIKQGAPINYEGASGPMDFDANGNISDRLARFQAQRNKFADLERYDCVASSDCPAVSP